MLISKLQTKKAKDNYRELETFEVKRIPVFIKAIDEDQGIVDHIVAVMGNVDDGNDLIPQGAFTKTLSERGRKVRVLDMHNTDSILRVIGKPLELREVGREELPAEVLAYAPDATGGLLCKTQFALSTDNGRNAFELIKGGYADESSIGYDATQVTYKDVSLPDGSKRKVRVLNEIRLWEYSAVIWGMNPATAVVGVKDADPTGEPAPEPEETPKEYDPTRGKIRRMGDVYEACMHRCGTGLLDFWYKVGLLSRDEWRQISSTLEGALESMYNGLPSDVAMRDLTDEYYYDYMAAYLELEAKYGPAPEQAEDKADRVNQLLSDFKAGRVLSDANAQRIQSAINTLLNVLEDAGLIETADDDSSDDKSEKPEASRPVEPPATSEAEAAKDDDPDTSSNLLTLLELEQLEADALSAA